MRFSIVSVSESMSSVRSKEKRFFKFSVPKTADYSEVVSNNDEPDSEAED